MKKIAAQLILGTKPSEKTMQAIIEAYPDKFDGDAQMQFQVFELKLDGKTLYASWSGGKRGPEGPELTLVGQAAFESLLNLPIPDTKVLAFVEMKLGPTPLLVKITRALEVVPDGGRVCLFGDLSKELDGQIINIFDLQGFKNLSH